MKHIRIKIIGNASYLVYDRGLVFDMVKIMPFTDGEGLKKARYELQQLVNTYRAQARKQDKLENKGSNSILRLLKEKRKKFARICFEGKKPKSKATHVGVEIEFLSSSNRGDIAADLCLHGLYGFVELKNDGSVKADSDDNCDGSCRDNCRCSYCDSFHYCDDAEECARRERDYGCDELWGIVDDCEDCASEALDDCDCGGFDENGEKICSGHIVCVGHCPGHSCWGYEDHPDYDCGCTCTCAGEGHEIAIVASSSKIKEIIEKVCKVLADHGASVNSTCGLHVHVDARGRDEKKMFANLVKSQKLLYAMVNRSRYRNQYCRPNDSLLMDAYNGRYHGINPQSFSEHGTIEVRLHSGTVNAEKINNWIELLQKIAYSKSITRIEKLSDLTFKVKLRPSLVEYIVDRMEKFISSHGTHLVQIDRVQALTQTETYFESAIAA